MDDEIEQFRDGIFSLHTRRFGKVPEIIIKHLYGFSDPHTNFYDLHDDDNDLKVEVKFGRALERPPSKLQSISTDNLLEAVEFEDLKTRMFSSYSWKETDFDTNIQQVKGEEFDVLYYGMFFSDIIKIFKLNSEDLNDAIRFSNKQHKGNVGEGQFHLNPETYQYHLDNFFDRDLTYPDVFELFS
jgi:hypothetical protein